MITAPPIALIENVKFTYEDLIQRRIALENVSNIIDPDAYVEEWNKLGADFKAIGFDCNAEACWRRWKHYQDQAMKGCQT